MTTTSIINVVSGKGGTGKTLLTSVLAEMLGNNNYNVLAVDMDVFVRGLTALLYFHKKEKIQLSDEEETTISEFFIHKGDLELSGKSKFSISRYRSFDVAPSVSRVDELLEFKDLMPDTKKQARDIVNALLNKISSSYDIVLLDSRAGYDELISATHSLSTLSICVEEDDDISKVTSDNLIAQLKEDADVPVFRVTNKARNVKDEKDLDEKGLTNLGKIPFDMDVMNNFGSKFFWEEISKTLYKSSLGIMWNKLVNKMNLPYEVEIIRVSPIGNEKIEKRLSLFTVKDRVFLLYGLVIGFIGVSYGVLGQKGFYEFLRVINEPQNTSFIVGLLGFAMSAYIIFKRNKK